MAIERLTVNTDKGPLVLGVNMTGRRGGAIHLFSISENQGGPLIAENLMTVTKAVLSRTSNQSLADVKWTFTDHERTTAFAFTTAGGQPYKLDVADMHAFDLEKNLRGGKFSLETYATKYKGLPPDYTAAPVMALRYPEVPRTVYCVPCDAAKDGTFYCEPAFMNTDHMRDDYEYIVADTKKLLAGLQIRDPDMLIHASRQFNGSAALDWAGSLQRPRDMGLWSVTQHSGLTLCSGQAAVIEAVRQLNLPFMPIAVEKAHGQDKINALVADIGYAPVYAGMVGGHKRGFSGPRP